MKAEQVLLAAAAVGGGVLLLSRLGRAEELPPPGMAALELRAVKPDAYMPNPRVYVDGDLAGTAPVLVEVSPGDHTVSWEDRPGGTNPAPGVEYYQAPAPQTVTVAEGQTLQVIGAYTIVAVSPPDVSLYSFAIPGTQPFAPLSQQTVQIAVTNPTARAMDYRVYVYPWAPADPPTQEPIVGSLGYGDLLGVPPGSWSYQFGIYMPAAEGTYPIWLRAYEMQAQWPVYIKRIDTGVSVQVGVTPPPPPLGWPIETQLASILSYVDEVWVLRNGLWLVYSRSDPLASNLQELYSGEMVYIEVTQAVTLTYGGFTWDLQVGWNTIVWV